MALEAFTLFQDLPPEIRISIWELAIRLDYSPRQVHRFFVVPDTIPPCRCVEGGLLRFDADGQTGYGWKLAVPHISGPIGIDSMYLPDSELWTACRESREVMERHFKTIAWHLQLPKAGRPQQQSLSNSRFNDHGVAHTASYVDPKGNENRIAIRPYADLVYLKPIGSQHFRWLSQLYPNGLDSIANGVLPNALPQLNFLGRNIAVDYDPALMDLLTYLPLAPSKTIWFIDHRLRRRGGAVGVGGSSHQGGSVPSAYGDERHVFFSQKSIFTEIRREDMSGWVVYGDGRNQTVFDFLAIMLQHRGGLTALRKPDGFKVLACEPRNGS